MRVAKLALDHRHRHPSLEQLDRVRVPQAVEVDPLLYPGLPRPAFEHGVRGRVAHGAARQGAEQRDVPPGQAERLPGVQPDLEHRERPVPDSHGPRFVALSAVTDALRLKPDHVAACVEQELDQVAIVNDLGLTLRSVVIHRAVAFRHGSSR